MAGFKYTFKKLKQSIRDEVDGFINNASPTQSNAPNAVAPAAAPRQPHNVFAHYMVGLTNGQSVTQWQKDISEAQSACIDGFALNIGADDFWTDEQLQMAYETAASCCPGFTMFLSFDMAASSWTVEQVVRLIARHKDAPAQFRVHGLPFVSTFEGHDWADNWARVRSEAGGVFLVPDWASIGPHRIGKRIHLIDGAFNWGAWPKANERFMSTHEDSLYRGALRGKPYMMGISPYFYTNLPQWNKNWYSSSDSLWYDRWKQIVQMQPEYVQIITWNDYGESSYINDPVPMQIVQGAEKYVQAFPHSAFRFVLPYFIAAYKAGHTNVPLFAEGAMAWYRTCPASATGECGTVWGQCGTHHAAKATEDVISIIALSYSPPSIQVSVGDLGEVVTPVDSFGAASFYQVPFNGRSGPVAITMNGRSTTGPAISSDSCAPDDAHLNAVAIQL